MSYGPPPQYQPYQPYQPNQPFAAQSGPTSNRARNGCIIGAFSVSGFIVLIIVAGLLLTSNADKAKHPATLSTTTTAASPSPSSAGRSGPLGLVATFSGKGIENTPKFTVGRDWKLEWSYNCSSFGLKGNFIVFEDGGRDLSGVRVNELGKGGHSTTYAYNDAGRHYLAVDSECAWKAKVIGTP